MDTPNNINNLQIMCPLFRGSTVKGYKIALPVFFFRMYSSPASTFISATLTSSERTLLHALTI